MSAEILRRAAALIRERAEWANEGPWEAGRQPHNEAHEIAAPGIGRLDGDLTSSDAAHIASMHPTVALAVADWLEHEADAHEQHRASATTAGLRIAPALTVARAYLGDAS